MVKFREARVRVKIRRQAYNLGRERKWGGPNKATIMKREKEKRVKNHSDYMCMCVCCTNWRAVLDIHQMTQKLAFDINGKEWRRSKVLC